MRKCDAFKILGRFRKRSRASPARSSAFLLLLPSVFFAGPTSAESAEPPRYCVDVEVDGQRQPSLECLSEQLQAAARAASPVPVANAMPDTFGHGEPNRVGTFTFTGEQERMGANFGHAASPQRPQAPAFANALSGRR